MGGSGSDREDERDDAGDIRAGDCEVQMILKQKRHREQIIYFSDFGWRGEGGVHGVWVGATCSGWEGATWALEWTRASRRLR